MLCLLDLVLVGAQASELVDNVSGVGDWGEKQAALCGVAVWLRLSAMRLLPWNRNYNIKPREISAAQVRLHDACTALARLGGATGRRPDASRSERTRAETHALSARARALASCRTGCAAA